MSSLSPPDVSSCLRVDDSEPSLARPHLKFDGSLMSNLVMAVNTSVFAGDFTVVLFVKAEQPVEGVLFVYTASDPDTTRLSSIQVAFNANSSLDVSLWSSSDGVTTGTLCSHLVVHGVFTNKTPWSKLVIQKNLSTRELQVSVDDLVWTTDYDCYDGSVQGSHGRLSIGGRDDGKGGAGFRGSLRCLMIFESVLDEVLMGSSQLETMCEQYGGAVSSDIPECEADADTRKHGFTLVMRDAHPAASAHPPIKSAETLSLVRCAEACMQAIRCKSFVITTGLMSRKECQFYDYVTKFNIVTSSGKNYYEIKNGI
ncbi:uncharacterized protein [Littorina saxatilis]|uniref:uncharacterized protein n=1 Tax=Littorina saxatilis TaxID=31220 RepID=UPI0038B6528D